MISEQPFLVCRLCPPASQLWQPGNDCVHLSVCIYFIFLRFQRRKTKTHLYQNFQPAVIFHNKHTASIASWHSLLRRSKRWIWRTLKGERDSQTMLQWIPDKTYILGVYSAQKRKILAVVDKVKFCKLNKMSKIQSFEQRSLQGRVFKQGTAFPQLNAPALVPGLALILLCPGSRSQDPSWDLSSHF